MKNVIIIDHEPFTKRRKGFFYIPQLFDRIILQKKLGNNKRTNNIPLMM